ncbi:MAG: rod shape-determining protein RodA [Acidimicrobiia bacterium]|nr:rod shape-determining protein RodA [Acidimicrobiia bacterium]MDH5293920.1 rod shape-determining protein RodA [Acidimicrobiia bacterium]
MATITGRGVPSEAVSERRRNRPDVVLLGAVLALSGFGLLMIYAATRVAREQSEQLATFDMERQMIFATAGIILLFVFSVLDYRELQSYLVVIGALTMGALGAVFLFPPIRGAQSWIPLGGFFQLQPSEFAKIVIILGVAAVLAVERRPGGLAWRKILFASLIVAIPAVLIFRQPDLGTTMVLPFVLLAMLFAAGLSLRQLLTIVSGAVLAVVAVFQFGLLKAHQLERIQVFLEPELDPQGLGYQLARSKLAIGSGQLFGKGLLNGAQTAVPDAQNDFIFAVIGEQFGFVGGLLVLAVFLVVIWRLFVIAANSRDRFGAMVAVGIAAMITFHVFVNVGMTIGIMPVTGLSLPFVSQGGSFYLAMAIAVGIANSIWLRRSPVPGESYIV